MEEKKQCPYCGKEILAVAKKCRYCRNWLTEGGMPYNTGIELPDPVKEGVLEEFYRRRRDLMMETEGNMGSYRIAVDALKREYIEAGKLTEADIEWMDAAVSCKADLKQTDRPVSHKADRNIAAGVEHADVVVSREVDTGQKDRSMSHEAGRSISAADMERLGRTVPHKTDWNATFHPLRFSGVLNRKDFWMGMLSWAIGISVFGGMLLIFAAEYPDLDILDIFEPIDFQNLAFWTVIKLLVIYTYFPLCMISAAVRRLRDAGKNVWLWLLGLIPIAGQIILIIMLTKPSVRQRQDFNF